MSPFTQYFVRKLLRRYLAQPQSLTPYINVADPAQVDLERLLRSLCPDEQEFTVLLFELENLIDHHSRIEANQARYSPGVAQSELVKIEQKVQKLLGLRLASLLPERLPRLLNESSGQSFQFCLERTLCAGICLGDQFYGLLRRLPNTAQLQAYQFAWMLSQQAVPCIITRSAVDYAIWINLKSPAAMRLLQQGDVLLPSLQKLSLIVQRHQSMLDGPLY